jgi:hypothetical protein
LKEEGGNQKEDGADQKEDGTAASDNSVDDESGRQQMMEQGKMQQPRWEW